MAISINTVFEVRTTGSDTNGGGFVTGSGGTDFSQQNAAQFSGTNLAVDATTNTKVTSATHTFAATDVGNIIQITAGTGWTTGFYQVVSVASGAATLDRSPGAVGTTGGTWALGGALASPGKAAAAASSQNNVIYVKAGTYSITSASTNISGGCVATAAVTRIEGYNATRGDLGTPPLFQASGAISSFTIVGLGLDSHAVNIKVDGASKTTSRGFNSGRAFGYKLQAVNCTNSGFAMGNAFALYISCTASGCSSQEAFTATAGILIGCEAFSNTATGINGTSGAYLSACLSYNNSGASSDGFQGGYLVNCSAYNNGRDGFRINGTGYSAVNCIAEGNAGVGYNMTTNNDCVLLNCAGYNNAGGRYSSTGNRPTVNLDIGGITGTSSFFTNAAGGDFSLNNTAGGGAVARAAGFPGAFPAGTTTGYLDLGAAQHSTGGGPSSTEVAYVFVG